MAEYDGSRNILECNSIGGSETRSGAEAEYGHSPSARERPNVVNKAVISCLLGGEVRTIEVELVKLRLRGSGALKHDAFVSVFVPLKDAEMLAHFLDTDLVATIVSPAWPVDEELAGGTSISSISG